MRYPPSRKRATRARILEAAARTFRRRGFSGAGVDDVMKAAGLTAGGFYSHFASKDALFAEVIQTVLREPDGRLTKGLEKLSGDGQLRALVERYLGDEHRCDVEQGCPMPPLLAEVARSGKRTRAAFEKVLARQLDDFHSRFPTRDGQEPRAAAIARLATMVGGMSLARAVADEHFAAEILAACRRALLADSNERRGRRSTKRPHPR